MPLKSVLKYIIARTYKPVVVKYLSRTRAYQYKGILLNVPSQVFHPGFFHSTKLLLSYISRQSLLGRSFLELGAGSGLISIFAAKRGAKVTATDINPLAVECLQSNMVQNGVRFRVIHSDLFDSIPSMKFDFVAINPPYYKNKVQSEADYAWFCGENGEYFQRLFSSLRKYIHSNSKVLLILCDACDLSMIHRMAEAEDLVLDCVYTKNTVLEKNFIFNIRDKL
jgi:release factor glutamine methyltransferase